MKYLAILIILLSSNVLFHCGKELHKSLFYKTVAQSVVEIDALDPMGKLLGGATGWETISDSGKPIIITNAHVCGMYSEIGDYSGYANIKLPSGEMVRRKILGLSRFTDLCAIEGAEMLKPLNIAYHKHFGQIVTVVGHPLLKPTRIVYGFLGFEEVVNMGIFGPLIDYENITNIVLPGNSGSPACNLEGKVIGVVSATNSENYRGLIIPLEDLRDFLATL